jgi:hypothetical protein
LRIQGHKTGLVLIERNRLWNFLRLRVDGDFDSGRVQRGKKFPVKGRHGLWFKRQHLPLAKGGQNLQAVVNKVILDFERFAIVRNRRGGYSSQIYVKGAVPPVVLEWRQGQSDLSCHLGPHVERVIGVFPLREWQCRPEFCGRRLSGVLHISIGTVHGTSSSVKSRCSLPWLV